MGPTLMAALIGAGATLLAATLPPTIQRVRRHKGLSRGTCAPLADTTCLQGLGGEQVTQHLPPHDRLDQAVAMDHQGI